MLKHLVLLCLVRAALGALSSDSWHPISVGLMMQRSLEDSCPTHHSLMKRTLAAGNARRDYKQTIGSIQRMNTGGVFLPDEEDVPQDGNEDKLHQRNQARGLNNGDEGGKQLLKREEGAFQSIITWYTGSDLLEPSCLNGGKWTPTDNSMIAAVTLNWNDKPPCGSFLELRHAKNYPNKTAEIGKAQSIVVRVMDSCAGCKAGTPHVDLTKAAFKQLYDLDIGYVTEIEVKMLDKPPFQHWGKQEESLYGPEKLGKQSSSSPPPASSSSSHWSGPSNTAGHSYYQAPVPTGNPIGSGEGGGRSNSEMHQQSNKPGEKQGEAEKGGQPQGNSGKPKSGEGGKGGMGFW